MRHVSQLTKIIMTKKSALFIFLLAVHPSHAQHPISSEIEGRIKRVENNLAGWVKIKGRPNWNILGRMRFYNAKGLSIAVINDYKVEWAKGYGWADTAEHRAVTPSTLFQAASIGKSIHAAAMLRLAEEMKLDLGRDINDYLKDGNSPMIPCATERK